MNIHWKGCESCTGKSGDVPLLYCESCIEGAIEDLTRALHDAINSPKGVVPKSADEFYDVSRCDPSLVEVR